MKPQASKFDHVRPRVAGAARALAVLSALSLLPLGSALAQQGATDGDSLEEVLVTGTRQVIRDAIEIKRSETNIVDGLSASDIGDLPALSIGEALETITGAASHRENGGATEISIRGLGPFLSATTFNGREATNGSGDRAVNFSQFPSELMSKLKIYKTQNASLIEGGVAGLIALETLKPLDYNKRRFQMDLKGNINPDQLDIEDTTEGDIGFRGTASYVDQFEFGNGARFGLSLGLQKSEISQPEAEVRSSSPTGTSRFACIHDPSVTNRGFYVDRDRDCEDPTDGRSNTGGYNTEVDPNTGRAIDHGLPFAFAPSSRGYRQNDTSDQRDAYFLAFQLQPNDRWNINFDTQMSERVQAEQRHDLNFANQKRATDGVTGDALVASPSGAILAWEGETAIESNSEIYSREEDYLGYGLNVEFDFSDRLRFSADYSYSETTREELQISLRTQSDSDDICYGDSQCESDLGIVDEGNYRPTVNWARNGDDVPQYRIEDFNVNSHALFSDEYRVRIDTDVDRENTVEAFRGDFEYDFEDLPIVSVQGGFRHSKQEYLNLDPRRLEIEMNKGGRFRMREDAASRLEAPSNSALTDLNRAAMREMNLACRNPSFPESGFLSAASSGPLVTQVDSSGNVVGGGNSWATFNTQCMLNHMVAHRNEMAGMGLIHADFNDYPVGYLPARDGHPDVTDVTETTLAAYMMANFNTEVAGYPVRGNIGIRVLETEVESVGYRTQYSIAQADDGTYSISEVGDGDVLEKVVAEDSYTEVLPSLSVIVDLSDELMLRGGIFRAISRADPADLGYNRSFITNSSDDITTPSELITNVNGAGNPFTEPLPSWNYDVSLEWYPNADSILAVSFYYKQFTGGFEQNRVTETFIIDGQPVAAPFTATETTDDTSDLYGLEVTGAYRWANGLGFKASYNWADSDFEFEDSLYGSYLIRDTDGSVLSQTAGIVKPGNVPGFSEQVFSGQLLYEWRGFDSALIYKYRSEYFQPYTSNGTRLRYVGDVGVWELRASYQLTKNLRLSLEAINIFDEPKSQYFFVDDALGELNAYGPRVFMGLRVKY